MGERRLVIVTGQEGVGKSTVLRALLPHTPLGAQFDAEDVGQVNPWTMDEAFKELLWRNVADLVRNFWEAGFPNVIAGSFLDGHEDYLRFMARLNESPQVYLVHLCASRSVRDERRIARAKPTSQAWRDQVDLASPEDVTLAPRDGRDYRYVRIDNDVLSLGETVDRIRQAIPEIYAAT